MCRIVITERVQLNKGLMHWSEKFEDMQKLNGREYTNTVIRVGRGRSARVFFVEERLYSRVLFMEYRGWVEDAASSRFFPRECVGQDENDRTPCSPAAIAPASGVCSRTVL